MESSCKIPFTRELAAKLGFTWNHEYEQWVDESDLITLSFNPYFINAGGKTCYMHVENQDYDTIGSLDFTYLEDFITMLKLCDKTELAERAQDLIVKNSLSMD